MVCLEVQANKLFIAGKQIFRVPVKGIRCLDAIAALQDHTLHIIRQGHIVSFRFCVLVEQFAEIGIFLFHNFLSFHGPYPRNAGLCFNGTMRSQKRRDACAFY